MFIERDNQTIYDAYNEQLVGELEQTTEQKIHKNIDKRVFFFDNYFLSK